MIMEMFSRSVVDRPNFSSLNDDDDDDDDNNNNNNDATPSYC